jgi:transcriptional regulator with XRE-family HTH domain
MNLKDENRRQIQTMRENMRLLREQKNWSVKKLSEISGIDEETLADIENGGDFGIAHLFKLCRLYKIKPRDIFYPVKSGPAAPQNGSGE